MVEPFLTAPSLDASATISILAFAVAIPLRAALVMVSRQPVGIHSAGFWRLEETQEPTSKDRG